MIQFTDLEASFKVNMKESNGNISVSVDDNSSIKMGFGEASGSFNAGFDESNSETDMDFGENGSAIVDHRFLSGRSSENQHPISAITNLEKELEEVAGTPFTNLELEALFK